jgi:alpha-tubulin suppressor-like RCC1 family protein
MVKEPSTHGPFDPSLDPTVEICELAGTSCTAVIATYTTTSGPGSERVRVQGDQYHVNWHTKDFSLDPAKTYRIRVLLLGLEIGFADVDVVSNGNELKMVSTNDFVPLKDGRTLPIKFRIEQGVLAGIFVRVSAGVGHTCAIDAAGAAWCWGNNDYGQLGDGTTTGRQTPVAVVAPSGAASSPTFVDISAGEDHTCARTSTGSAWCWGMDADGQLGDGPTSAEHCHGPYPCSTRPVAVLPPAGGSAALAFIDIDAGRYFTCGVASAGAGYCWGFGGDGQLGVLAGNPSFPLAVAPPDGSTTPLKFVDIDAGRLHSCAVAVGGGAWCWGRNVAGQVGNGSSSFDPASTDTPVAVVPPSGSTTPVIFANVSAARDGSCGLASNGAAWCWGPGGLGELGNGATAPDDCGGPCSTRPVAVSGSHVFSIVSNGSNTSCGLTTSGEAWCWGYGSGGRLGNGSSTNSNVPVAVSGGIRFVQLDAGGNHACAVTADGAIWCWGENADGQLGNGSTTSSAVPVRVVGGP